eukprot:g67824.t1
MLSCISVRAYSTRFAPSTQQITFPVRLMSTVVVHKVVPPCRSSIVSNDPYHWELRNITHVMLDADALPNPVSLPWELQSRISPVIQS